VSQSWTDPVWLDGAHAWIAGEMRRLGTEVTGAIEQPHIRPWSTVLRVPTEAGDAWFKASVEPLAHEPAVIEILTRRRPDCLPRLLALDRQRGWMLQGDGGVCLRDLQETARWEDVLPLYAGLQAEAVGDVDELLAARAPDRRLSALPVLYEDLLRRQRGIAGEDLRRLADLAATVARLCEALEAAGLPETVQHDDLSSGNVFVHDGGYVFFDWGDSCVAHPFFTLHVTLRVLAWELDVEPTSKDLVRFRDAYLAPWTHVTPRADLVRALEPAELLGGLARAIGWQALLDVLPPAARHEYADTVRDRLAQFLVDCR
jgi:Phosphotransferase enzyme family